MSAEKNVCFTLPSSHQSFLKRGIIEKFLNQVNMSQQHPAAAVPFQTQGIESITEIFQKIYFVNLVAQIISQFDSISINSI